MVGAASQRHLLGPAYIITKHTSATCVPRVFAASKRHDARVRGRLFAVAWLMRICSSCVGMVKRTTVVCARRVRAACAACGVRLYAVCGVGCAVGVASFSPRPLMCLTECGAAWEWVHLASIRFGTSGWHRKKVARDPTRDLTICENGFDLVFSGVRRVHTCERCSIVSNSIYTKSQYSIDQ